MVTATSWLKVVKNMGGVAWTEEEDHLLKKCIQQYGEGKWHRVPVLAGLNRCRKSCRLRWLNYLRPNIRRGTFTNDEVFLLIKLHSHLGNRWSLIASRLSGRTANDVKNFWNCHLSKKLDKLNLEDNPTSVVSTNNQVSLAAHHNFPAITGISTTSSLTNYPQDQDKESSEWGINLVHEVTSINICKRGGWADGENEVNELTSEFEFEETSFKGEAAGGHFSSMDDNIGDWDELIFDMDLWG